MLIRSWLASVRLRGAEFPELSFSGWGNRARSVALIMLCILLPGCSDRTKHFNTAEECLLEKLKGVESESATNLVMEACYSMYPSAGEAQENKDKQRWIAALKVSVEIPKNAASGQESRSVEFKVTNENVDRTITFVAYEVYLSDGKRHHIGSTDPGWSCRPYSKCNLFTFGNVPAKEVQNAVGARVKIVDAK